MGKKIQNEETKVKKDTTFNDIDILNDTLLTFKFLVDNFAVALNEASNKWIYDNYNSIFEKLTIAQANLFQFTFSKGWYKLEQQPKSKITQDVQKFNQSKTELDSYSIGE